MKRLFAIFVLCFAFFCASAQTQHLKFMKISMDNTLSNFVSQLKAKGFTTFKEEASTVWMEGPFAGEQVMLQILGTPTKQGVEAVLVKFGADTKFTFESLLSIMEQKYGFDVMTFDEPFIVEEKEHVAWVVDKDGKGMGNVVSVCKNMDDRIYVAYTDLTNNTKKFEEELDDF